MRAGEPVAVEVNNRQVQVAGLFALGTSFGIDGSVLTSETNFLRIFPNRQRGLIELGLVRRRGRARIRCACATRSARRCPHDVLVLTRAEFIAKERAYWDASTPIGYVFAFGVAVGLVVGGIIVYQILFADVSDHLAEYATLKAMGYSNAYLSGVVIQQAVILAVLGFLPGLAICLLLYRISSQATRLPLEMTWPRGLGVLGLTVAHVRDLGAGGAAQGALGRPGGRLLMSAAAPIQLEHVNHYFGGGALRRQILFDVSVAIRARRDRDRHGPSGSGKTTLLTLIGALRSAQEGSVRVLGAELRGARQPRARGACAARSATSSRRTTCSTR